MLAQCSSIQAITYTTQVRSSGSQVYVENKNHRAEPDPVLRRAPTLTDEQRQLRVGLRCPLSIRALAGQLEGKTSGKLKIRPSKAQTAVLEKARLQGLISNPHGQTMENLQTLYLAPRCVNQDVSMGVGMTTH